MYAGVVPITTWKETKLVEDNNIRERMPWLFGGEQWVNKPSGWGHPYGCIDPAGRTSIANDYRRGRRTISGLAEHWGVSTGIVRKILHDHGL